ncbi:MAG: MFS transporter [Gammaproteobacteria bacterium]|nr:MFS transporter [Gammaproteobacteria bacterium]
MSPLLTLFLIVFIDLLGFGIILPLFPFVAEKYGAAPWLITFGGAGIYALAQVIATPIWGRLSDSVGRKPVLMISMLGAVGGHLMLGFSDSLAMLIVARAFSGLMSGNISAAFAYVADITTPENRAKGLGTVGAAFGLGFMFGPMIGGLLGGPDAQHLSLLVPALVGAGLSTLAVLGTLFALPESLKPEHRKPWRGEGSGSHSPFAAVQGKPVLVGVVVAALLLATGGAAVQSVLPVWGADILDLSPRDVGWVFFVMGAVGVTVQGGLVGRLVRRYGEKPMLYASLGAHVVGYGVMAFAHNWTSMWAGTLSFAVGHAIFNTTASSLLSIEAEPRDRGAALGALQASTAAGRIVGPASSGALYDGFGHAAPFLACAALLVPAALLLSRSHKGDRPHEPVEP